MLTRKGAPLSSESVDDLMARGFDLIEDQDFEGAVEVGEQLQDMRHSSGFEILALAHAGLGNLERAVEILEDGTVQVPKLWVLWQLLGNSRSELGRYAEAHEAYREALECPDVDNSSVHLNVSIALSRQERFDEALMALNLVGDDELLPRAESQRLDIYNIQGKYEDVIERGERLLASLSAEADDEVRSAVLAHVGQAYWKGRNDREQALKLAWEALGHSYGVKGALWLIRAVEAQVSSKAQYYRLLVEGDWHECDEDGGGLGFFATYDVVADDVAEAIMFVRRFEPDAVGDSLVVSKFEALEDRPTEPKGVYSYTGHNLFPREREDHIQPSKEDS